jgi:cell wall-associated NlpC family hydrolase
MTTRNEFILAAREWVGTPFLHRGRVLGRGVDCIGVPVMAGTTLGMIEADSIPVSYSKDPDGIEMMQWLRTHMKQIHDKSDLKPADILVFRFARYPQHVGVYTGRTVIHSYQSLGKCIEHSLDERWRKRLIAVFRFKEFADVV